MQTRTKLLALAAVGLGSALGYLAASGNLAVVTNAWADEKPEARAQNPRGGSIFLPRPERKIRAQVGRTYHDSKQGKIPGPPPSDPFFFEQVLAPPARSGYK
jgi:hypothetical protein